MITITIMLKEADDWKIIGHRHWSAVPRVGDLIAKDSDINLVVKEVQWGITPPSRDLGNADVALYCVEEEEEDEEAGRKASEAFKAGYALGLSDGKEAGIKEGFDQGFAEGEAQGKAEGE